MPVEVVFVIFPGVTQLDFTGPAQVLARMPGARIHIAANNCDPVATDCGFAIVPTTGFASCLQADILCVPGGHGVRDALQDGACLPFIAAQAPGARWVTSVCTGAFLLGAAGLLEGRRATCHWAYTELLPLVGAVAAEGRVVEDGNLITAGGVTSGIDFALMLVARQTDENTARAIQLALEYDPAPPFAGGHPRTSPPATTRLLRRVTYDAAMTAMREALEKRGTAFTR